MANDLMVVPSTSSLGLCSCGMPMGVSHVHVQPSSDQKTSAGWWDRPGAHPGSDQLARMAQEHAARVVEVTAPCWSALPW